MQAYAKFLGSYEALSSVSVHQMLLTTTGGITEYVSLLGQAIEPSLSTKELRTKVQEDLV